MAQILVLLKYTVTWVVIAHVSVLSGTGAMAYAGFDCN